MKNFNKLSFTILLLGATLIVFSFIPELELWKKFFQYEMKHGWECQHYIGNVKYNHWHWNYRGWIWFLTGFALFIIHIVRILVVFRDRDFKQ